MIQKYFKSYTILSFFYILIFRLGFCIANNNYVVIIPTFNNIKFWEKNLTSVFNQGYKAFRVIIINDNSSDGTGEAIEKWLHSNNIKNVKFYTNNVRNKQLSNTYRAIHTCHSDEIVVIVDGDDWLAHDKVFNRLNREYNRGYWLTYGQFKQFPSGKVGGSTPLIKNTPVRGQKWVLSHLRTFYAGLFKQIKLKDLLYNDKFFPCCADFATMFPMAEMSGNRISFIPDILYVYNKTNPLHCGAQMGYKMLGFLNGYIRRKASYKICLLDCKKDYEQAEFKVFKKDVAINQIKNSIRSSNVDFIVLSDKKQLFEEGIRMLNQTKLDILIMGKDDIDGTIISNFDSSKEHFAVRYRHVRPSTVQSLIMRTKFFYKNFINSGEKLLNIFRRRSLKENPLIIYSK